MADPEEPPHHRLPVDMGDLRSLEPLTRSFGFERGRPIDRFYIEAFLERHSADVRGRVLEVLDSGYTRAYGGDRVTRSDILHVDDSNPSATIVADLANAPQIRSAVFDCFICTQTLMYVYDVAAAARTIHRILRPGGVLLVTVPAVSQVNGYEMSRQGEFWRFTSRAVQRLFEDAFPGGTVDVQAHGNVLVATAFLQGMATEDLTPDELNARDADYEVLITGRAVKGR